MPKITNIQTNFTAGEVAPRLLGRVDIAKYANGADTVENLIVRAQGGVQRRGGTKHVWPVETAANRSRLIPFVFSVTQAYVLEFTDSVIRVFKDQGIVTETAVTITAATKANPVEITAASHGYSNGDKVVITGVGGMTEINGFEFTVANQTTNTFELSGIDGTSYTTYTSGGTAAKIVEIASPWSASEAQELDYTQSADTLYLVHGDYAPRTLTRSSHTSWTLSTADIVAGPFQDINTDDTFTLTPSGGSATAWGTYAVGETGVTLTASSSLFASTDVGRLVRLWVPGKTGGWPTWVQGYTNMTLTQNDIIVANDKFYAMTNKGGTGNTLQETTPPSHEEGTVRIYRTSGTGTLWDAKFIHDGSCVVKITGYTSATVVTVTVVKNEVDPKILGGTSFWHLGSFSDTQGWPKKVSLYEQRLWFGGSANQPQTLWASKSRAYLDFQDGADDDDAVQYTIASEQIDAIRWISGGRVLNVGTTSGEYTVSATSSRQAVTPTDISIRQETSYGSADVRPVRAANTVIFAQRHGDVGNPGRKIREYNYDFNIDGYSARDMTILSDHITGAGISGDLVLLKAPDPILFGIRSDGRLAAMTYEKDQEVFAWHRHTLGGYSDAGGTAPAVVENAAVIPGTDGDELWLVVKRYIDGGTVRHIEVVSVGLDTDGDKEDATFFDAHLTYSGSATTTLTGATHLVGETVGVWGDGADMGDFTVAADGSIALTESVTDACVGLRPTFTLKTLRPEAGARGGSAQTRPKRISEVWLRLWQSYGVKVGPTAAELDTVTFREAGDAMDTGYPLLTGDKRIDFRGGWEREGQIVLQDDHGGPFNLSALIYELRVTG